MIRIKTVFTGRIYILNVSLLNLIARQNVVVSPAILYNSFFKYSQNSIPTIARHSISRNFSTRFSNNNVCFFHGSRKDAKAQRFIFLVYSSSPLTIRKMPCLISGAPKLINYRKCPHRKRSHTFYRSRNGEKFKTGIRQGTQIAHMLDDRYL